MSTVHGRGGEPPINPKDYESSTAKTGSKFQPLKKGKIGEVARISSTIAALQKAISAQSDLLNKSAGTTVELTGTHNKVNQTIQDAEGQIRTLSNQIKNLPETTPNKAGLRQQLQDLRQQVDSLQLQLERVPNEGTPVANAIQLRNEVLELCQQATNNKGMFNRSASQWEEVGATLINAANKVKELQSNTRSPEIQALAKEAQITLTTTITNLEKEGPPRAGIIMSAKQPFELSSPNKTDLAAAPKAKIAKEAKIKTLSTFSRIVHTNVAKSAKNIESIATGILEAKAQVNKALAEPKSRPVAVAELRQKLADAKQNLANQRVYLAERTRSSAADTAQKSIARWEAEIQTLEQKIGLLEGLSNRDYTTTTTLVEIAYEKLATALKEHKSDPEASALALHQAATTLEELEKNPRSAEPLIAKYQKEQIETLRETINTRKEALLALSAPETQVKEKLLRGESLSENESALLNGLFAKILTKEIHFPSTSFSLELDRLLELAGHRISGPSIILPLIYKTNTSSSSREFAVRQLVSVDRLLNGIQNGTTPIEQQAYAYQSALTIYDQFDPGEDPLRKQIKTEMKQELDRFTRLPKFMETSSLPNAALLEAGQIPMPIDIKNVAAFLSAKMVQFCYTPTKHPKAFDSIAKLMGELQRDPLLLGQVIAKIAGGSKELYEKFVDNTVFHYGQLQNKDKYTIWQGDKHQEVTLFQHLVISKNEQDLATFNRLINSIQAKSPEWAREYLTAERFGVRSNAQEMLDALKPVAEARPYLTRLQELQSRLKEFENPTTKDEKTEAFVFNALMKDFIALQKEISEKAPGNTKLANILTNFKMQLDDMARADSFMALTGDKAQKLQDILTKGLQESVDIGDPETPRRLGIILSKQLAKIIYLPSSTAEQHQQLQALLGKLCPPSAPAELQEAVLTPEIKNLLVGYILIKSPVAAKIREIQQRADDALQNKNLGGLTALLQELNTTFGPIITLAQDWDQGMVLDMRNQLQAKLLAAKEQAASELKEQVLSRAEFTDEIATLNSLASKIKSTRNARELTGAIQEFDRALTAFKAQLTKEEASVITSEAFDLTPTERNEAVLHLQNSPAGKMILKAVKDDTKKALNKVLESTDTEAAKNSLIEILANTKKGLLGIFQAETLFSQEELQTDPAFDAIWTLCISSGPHHVWGSNNPDEGAIAQAIEKLDAKDPKTQLLKEIFSDFKIRPKDKPEGVQKAETMSLVFNLLSDLRLVLTIPSGFTELAQRLPIDESLKEELLQKNTALVEAATELRERMLACFDEETRSKIIALQKEVVELTEKRASKNQIDSKTLEIQALLKEQIAALPDIIDILQKNTILCYNLLSEFFLTEIAANDQLTQNESLQNATLSQQANDLHMATIKLNTGGLPQLIDDMLRWAPVGSQRREVLLELHHQIRARAAEINQRR